MRASGPLAALALLWFWVPPAVRSQISVISNTVTCVTCQIESSMARELGSDPDGPFEGRPIRFMFSDGRGVILAATRVADRPLAFVDRTGAIKGIGRSGSGPGEYRAPTAFSRTPGDSVLVFDQANRLLTLLSPSLAFVRSWKAPFNILQFIHLHGDQYLINSMIGTRELIGFPLHIITLKGELIRSFGESREPRLAGSVPDRRYLLRQASRLYTIPEYWEYRVDEWSSDGSFKHSYLRRPEWFPPYKGMPSITSGNPPAPTVGGGWIDGDGVLWVFVRVPSRTWKAELEGKLSQVEGGAGYAMASLEKLEETMVEAIDLRNGALLAARRLPFRVGSVLEDGSLVVYHTDARTGSVATQLWRVRLVQ
jgi:hypothetical protein